jgi:CMP-N,N'-diacetyllegionaminic acid synthase
MYLKKKILALVPARGGSKGIKLKNLRKVNGISLLGYTSQFINKCNFFDEKLVSTDSKKIIDETKKLKLKVFKRSKTTSGDFASDYEVINEVLNDKKIKKKKYDYIVYLQPTSPLRKVSQLSEALKVVINKNYDASWSVAKIDKKFHPKKILKISKDKFLSIYLKAGKKVFARQELEDIYIRNGIFYIFKVSKFLNSTDIFFKKNYPSVTHYPHVNIDSKKDLNNFRKLIN